jgi:soluble lytic murein transglycosylase-like protein
VSAPRNTAGVLAVVAAGLIVAPPGTADAAPARSPGLSSLTGTVTDALGLTTTGEAPPATTATTPATTATTPAATTTESAPAATTTESTTTAPAAPVPAPTTTTAPATPAPAPTTTTQPATPAKPSAKDDATVGDDSGGNGRAASAKHARAEKRRKAAARAKADRAAAKAERKERRAEARKAKAEREATKEDGADADDAALSTGETEAGGTGSDGATTAGPGLDVADLLAPPSAVPNFFLSRFQIPPFLLPIYQAAGVQYGVRWEILAAINEIETDYGRNLNVSTAGALGWMQFMPATWQTYGVDANGDDKADPYNPVDAIFASARYLKAAGAETDIRKAIFAYNHADWYVDSVMLRARLISGLPADLVGSLTGLTQGVFPVSGDTTYAGAAKPEQATAADGSSPLATGAAATTDDGDDADDASAPRRGIQIDAQAGADAVAVQDGTVTALGETERLGRYVQLRDVFGNRYTYAHLDELAKTYPAAAEDAKDGDDAAEAESKLATPKDPAPDAPATAGRQRRSGEDPPGNAGDGDDRSAAGDARDADQRSATGDAQQPSTAAGAAPAGSKDAAGGRASGPQAAERPPIFANPTRPGTGWGAEAGQQTAAPTAPATGTVPGDLSATDPNATPPAGAAVAPAATPEPVAKDGVVQLPLKRGARVSGGTVLGTVGRKPTAPAADPQAPEPRAKMTFKVRPAGKGAPQVNPKPLLDGWKLLASTEIYRAKDGNALFGAAGDSASAGQVLLMSKAQLENRVLADRRIDVYALGRQQIQAGLVDRRVLATLAYLSANGHRVAVSSLRRPGSITTSGNLSEHDSGNAVDIAAVDGQAISAATQGAGTITERTIRLLLQLQGTMKPHQIISLMTPSDFGGADNVLSLPDHADHIHVGFHVESTDSAQLGQQLASALKPGQWDDLIARLGKIENPDVPTTVSKYAVKATRKSRKP